MIHLDENGGYICRNKMRRIVWTRYCKHMPIRQILVLNIVLYLRHFTIQPLRGDSKSKDIIYILFRNMIIARMAVIIDVEIISGVAYWYT